MSYEEEKKCPLCAEEMDWTDQQLNPCKCGYEVCVWCWHHILDMAEKESTEGRCPACQTPYDKDRVVGLETNFQRVARISSSRKPKVTKAKPKQNEGRKDLSNVRVIQRKMVFIIGLPVDYAYEELLERKEYFGQYGKVTKVSLSRTAGGILQQFIKDTCSVYVTFSKEEEAVRCIQSVHGYDLDGRILRASFGTAKYCHAWLRNTSCNNPGCLYLHTMGADEDSFGKDEVAAVHTRNRVQEIVGATKYPPRRCGNMLPPPVVEQSYSYSASADDPVRNDGQKSVASSDHLPCSKDPADTFKGYSYNSWWHAGYHNQSSNADNGGINFSDQDSFENKYNRYKSQHQASRGQNLTPPGFPILSKPAPGFSGCMRTDQAVTPGSAIASRAQNLTPPGFPMLSKSAPGFSGCMRTDQTAPGSGSTSLSRRAILEAKVDTLRELLRINKHRWLCWQSFHFNVFIRIELLKDGIHAGESRLPDLLLFQQQAALDGLIRLLHFTDQEIRLLRIEADKSYADYLGVLQELG